MLKDAGELTVGVTSTSSSLLATTREVSTPSVDTSPAGNNSLSLDSPAGLNSSSSHSSPATNLVVQVSPLILKASKVEPGITLVIPLASSSWTARVKTSQDASEVASGEQEAAEKLKRLLLEVLWELFHSDLSAPFCQRSKRREWWRPPDGIDGIYAYSPSANRRGCSGDLHGRRYQGLYLYAFG